MRTLGRLIRAGVVLVMALGAQGTGHVWAARPNTVPEVPLVVTVHPLAEHFDGVERDCRICDDGLGPYTDGTDGVSARLDQYGALIINTNATRSATVRKFTFIYNDPVTPGNPVPPADRAQTSYMSTRFGTLGKIQSMNPGDIQCVESAVTFKIDDQARTEVRNLFHRGADLTDTSYVVVTRLADDPTSGKRSWQVEPKAFVGDDGLNGCNPAEHATVANVHSVPTRGFGESIDYGDWRLPFRMTLVEK